MQKITIYTDGSSRGNPGPGGWGAVILNDENSVLKVKEMGGREEKTTNNRMEMRAGIEALRYVGNMFLNTNHKNELAVEIFTDSEYLMKGITIWIKNWQKNNWQTKDKKDVLNKDLWQELFLETEKLNVYWKKVEGHSGDFLNERCDFLATSFADNNLPNLFEGLWSDYKK